MAKRTLKAFWGRFPDAEDALKSWYGEAEQAQWKTPSDIKAKYGNASIVAGNRVVFNICGNKYRLVAHAHYNTGFLFIRFIGTHSEYDAIDVTAV
jgi:mRNA interferase HigB